MYKRKKINALFSGYMNKRLKYPTNDKNIEIYIIKDGT